MLDYATRHWQTNHVTLSIQDPAVLSEFLVRPFFTIIRVDAPVLLRWRREQYVCIHDPSSDDSVNHIAKIEATK